MPFLDTLRLEVLEPIPGWKGRFFNSEQLTFGHYRIDAAAEIPPHSHPNEEVWQVIEGLLEITVAGERYRAGAGCVAIVPPNTEHAVRALTSARAIVVDWPRRESLRGVRLS